MFGDPIQFAGRDTGSHRRAQSFHGGRKDSPALRHQVELAR
jgi:hypothetical protein